VSYDLLVFELDGVPRSASKFAEWFQGVMEEIDATHAYVESCVEDRLPGAATGAKRAFEGFPPPDRYADLMEGYAREGARPA
jgi:hypothetical protein